jgi:2,4-dienoyl-CoA reductase-like NADH-dependent reductase (Old Yellow Enzyme family)
VRLGEEVVAAILRAVGPDVPIMFRCSQHKQQDCKARLVETPQQLATFLAPLTGAGVYLYDVSARRFYEPAFAADRLTPEGWTQRLSGKPTVAAGSAGMTQQGSPEQIAAFIGRGEFDLIGVGRAVLHDPAWADRVRRGETLSAFDPAALKIRA